MWVAIGGVKAPPPVSCSPLRSHAEASPLKRWTPCPPPTLRLPTSRPSNPISRHPNLRISTHRRGFRTARACSNGLNLDSNSEPDGAAPTSKEVSFDIKLPRRSLLVQFTCNACGETTQRTINRVAYERGTVYIQCAGCLVNHLLVDNLGLVVEYDLREDLNVESSGKDKE